MKWSQVLPECTRLLAASWLSRLAKLKHKGCDYQVNCKRPSRFDCSTQKNNRSKEQLEKGQAENDKGPVVQIFCHFQATKNCENGNKREYTIFSDDVCLKTCWRLLLKDQKVCSLINEGTHWNVRKKPQLTFDSISWLRCRRWWAWWWCEWRANVNSLFAMIDANHCKLVCPSAEGGRTVAVVMMVVVVAVPEVQHRWRQFTSSSKVSAGNYWSPPLVFTTVSCAAMTP